MNDVSKSSFLKCFLRNLNSFSKNSFDLISFKIKLKISGFISEDFLSSNKSTKVSKSSIA